VTTLPATGAGESSDSTGLYGAAALGAAAALYAAKKMRETPEASTEE
jgi:LPXTG-motif cell wall-anchored protein